MSEYIQNCYEVIDLGLPVVGQRSKLYSLTPIGIGTSEVESLTSYTARLSEAHCINPRVLVIKTILPLIGRNYLSQLGGGGLFSIWTDIVLQINGRDTSANDWKNAIEHLTLRDDIQFLTLLPWADVIPSNRLIKRMRAWCPLCLQEWIRTEKIIYGPLLWTLQAVTVCSKHMILLETHCPHCGKTMTVLSSETIPGHCSYCQGFLTPASDNKRNGDNSSCDNLTYSLWMTESIGELLAASPSISALPRRENIADIINMCIDNLSDGNVALFSQKTQINSYSLHDWKRGKSIPALGALLHMCYMMNIAPLNFMIGDLSMVNFKDNTDPSGEGNIYKNRRAQTSFNINKLQLHLNDVLKGNEYPPPSMREVSRRINCRHALLHHHFPEHCKSISAKYLAYKKSQRIEWEQRLYNEVRQITIDIYKEGHYPRVNAVVARLQNKGNARSHLVNAAWHQTLRELDLED